MRTIPFPGCALAATFVAANLWATQALAAYADIILADNPIGYWRFEETTGTTAVDSSGNGRDGTYQPGVTLGAEGAAAIGGFSAEFDGITGYVDLPGIWGGGPEATVEAWVNPAGFTGDFQSIVSGHDPNTFVHFQLFDAGNTGAYTDGGFTSTPIIPVEPIDQWRHVAMVIQPGDSRIYVDGELLEPLSDVWFDEISESENVDIGLGHVNTRWFDGLIDEVAIYDFALSQEELQAHISAALVGSSALLAGDADEDFKFDQLDLVKVQIAGKYLTGQAATWGDGDWDGAPGGEPGSPPAGDGLFNQLDIIAALNAGVYLTGPYNAVLPGGQAGHGQTSIIYDTNTGELAVDTPAGIELTSINLDSAAGIFSGSPALNLGGSSDHDADNNIFKATFGSSFGAVSFGNVARADLSQEFVLGDLSVIGSLAGGGDLGNVDLIYVPEPSTIGMLVFGMLLGLRCFIKYDEHDDWPQWHHTADAEHWIAG